MAGLIRSLLIYLLMLAIPAQGAAVVTMAFCGPAHHGSAMAATADHAAADHATAGPAHGGDQRAADHPHPGAHHADTSSANDHGVLAQATADAAEQHKCNVCGSCCSTGAPMGTVPALPVADAASTAFATVVATVHPFAADGPDRPPRIFLV